jgi:hypothetical protein
MDLLKKLQEKLDVKITQDFNEGDNFTLECYEMDTADGYTVYVISKHGKNIVIDEDVYYYQPQFDEVIHHLESLKSGDSVYMDQIDEFLPEDELGEYLG